jgi:PAS domain S-box-containing protein
LDALEGRPEPTRAGWGTELRHRIARYGFAIAVVAVAALLRGALGLEFPGVVPFATFFPAVLLATLLGGLGPGLLATSLGALLGWSFWLQPSPTLASPSAAVPVNLALFVLACLCLVGTAEAARRYHAQSLAAARRIRAAEDLALDGFGILEAVRDRRQAIVDLRWLYANPAMQTLLQRGEDLAGGRLLEQLPGHRGHPDLFPSYVEVIQTGQPKEAELFYEADGIRAWLRIAAVKLDDGIALSLRDITGDKEHATALQESEERFRLLADAVDDVFWIIDVRQRRVVYVSAAYERDWGFSAALLYRDPRAWRANLHPEDRALADQAFDQMLAGRRDSFELVYRVQASDGAVHWVRDKAWLVRAGDGPRIAGIMTDISAEKVAEEKQRLLSQELDHRLKNSFTLIQSVLRLSARSARDLGDFVDGMEKRIQALARSQDVLVRGDWHIAGLEEIVRETLALHASREHRLQIEGPPVHVVAGAVPLFHMAFNELATNAAKYGALSVPGGQISVRWQTLAEARGQALRLTWQESDGPAVGPPGQRGFGSVLIEQALAAEFGGESRLDFVERGLCCTMTLPFSERLTLGRDAA